MCWGCMEGSLTQKEGEWDCWAGLLSLCGHVVTNPLSHINTIIPALPLSQF